LLIHDLEDFQRSLASSKPGYLNKPFDTEVIMAEFDWHADRSDLDGLALLDRTPEDTGIDLAAVRAWRQGRVRREMAVARDRRSDPDGPRQHPLRQTAINLYEARDRSRTMIWHDTFASRRTE
jgi:hypothetical protein